MVKRVMIFVSEKANAEEIGKADLFFTRLISWGYEENKIKYYGPEEAAHSMLWPEGKPTKAHLLDGLTFTQGIEGQEDHGIIYIQDHCGAECKLDLGTSGLLEPFNAVDAYVETLLANTNKALTTTEIILGPLSGSFAEAIFWEKPNGGDVVPKRTVMSSMGPKVKYSHEDFFLARSMNTPNDFIQAFFNEATNIAPQVPCMWQSPP